MQIVLFTVIPKIKLGILERDVRIDGRQVFHLELAELVVPHFLLLCAMTGVILLSSRGFESGLVR